MTAAHALDPLIEQMLPAATDLAVCVRDRDTEGVHRILAPVLDASDRDQTAALLIALAVMVPDDATFGDLVAWTHIDEPDQDQEQIPFGELVTDPGEKYCRGCKQTRPFRQFYVDRSRHDGHTSRCKFCVAARVERNEARRAGLDAHSVGEGAA